jgi:drug/metabolite transporter (DMT)-like permease
VNHERRAGVLPTVLGAFAILFWGSNIAVARTLSETLGPVTAAACVYGLSGCLSFVYFAVHPRGLRRFAHLPGRYIFGCGGIFVVYAVCLYLAVGLAAGRQQVIEVSIINYLWPTLTLALSVPILKKRARPLLMLGMVLAMAGIVLAMTGGISYSWHELAQNIGVNGVPYCLAFGAAVTWGVYSNLIRRWQGDEDAWATPVFLLASAGALALARLAVPEETTWTSRAFAELAYMSIFPTILAYTFWDAAMRRGNVTLVASLSYFTPILSILISSIHMDIRIGSALWGACALVTGGAIICNRSVTD